MIAYLIYEGKKYFGYDVIKDGTSYFPHTEKKVIINRTLYNQLRDMSFDGFDRTFFPAAGSDIHTVPPCSVPVDDLRKNYNLKRGDDSGCCNVFSPLEDYYGHENYNSNCCIVVPKKTLYISSSDNSTLALLVLNQYPDIKPSDLIFFRNSYANYDTILYEKPLSDTYLALLNGKLKNPCIPVSNLSLNSSNELTVDVLHIVYQTCSKRHTYSYEFTDDEEKNAVVELNVLNNYNWREYPGTMSLLFNTLLATDRHSESVVGHMRGRSSRYPKAIKLVLSVENSSFVSEKDMNMGKQLVRTLTGMGDRKFVRFSDLDKKLKEIHLEPEIFGQLFEATTKLDEKEFVKDEEKED